MNAALPMISAKDRAILTISDWRHANARYLPASIGLLDIGGRELDRGQAILWRDVQPLWRINKDQYQISAHTSKFSRNECWTYRWAVGSGFDDRKPPQRGSVERRLVDLWEGKTRRRRRTT